MQKVTLDCFQLHQFGLSEEECTRMADKTVYLIRHSESVYNTDPRKQHCQKCSDESLLDCKLSNFGKVQSAEIAKILEQCGGVNSFDLVLSSPLLRARQTAAIAFKGSTSKRIIINPLAAEKVDSYSDVTREEMSMDSVVGPVDDDTEELLDYEWVLAESDLCSNLPKRFTLDCGYPFESLANVNMRIRSLWRWLADRPERKVAIFTHYKLIGSKNRDYGLIGFLGVDAVENAGIVELTFSRGGWRVMDERDQVWTQGVCAAPSVLSEWVFDTLRDAQIAAERLHKCIIIEEPRAITSATSSSSSSSSSVSGDAGDAAGTAATQYIVKACDSHRAFQVPTSLPTKSTQATTSSIPRTIHVAPVDVCIGIGTPHPEMHTQRVHACVALLHSNPAIRSIIWTDSEQGISKSNFLTSLGSGANAVGLSLVGRGGGLKIIVDARAKSTLGHARFSLERVLQEVVSLRCHIRLHVVTSSFHMERTIMVFSRACAAMLVPEGYNFDIIRHPCEHTGEAIEESAHYVAGGLHHLLEERQRERNMTVTDDDVRYSWE